MKHVGQGVPFLLLLFLLFPALYFQLPLSSGSSDLSEIDALAAVEVVAKGFKEPTGIVVDSSGAIFVSDRKTGEILKITAGEVHPLITHLKRPVGLSFDANGRLLIVEEESGSILRLESDSTLTILAQGMKKPRWVSVAEDGSVYITAKGLKLQGDKENDEENEEEEKGEVVFRLAQGQLSAFVEGFKGLQGLAIQERTLFAAARGLKKEKDDKGGIFKISIQSDGKAGGITRVIKIDIKRPFGLALDILGALYVTAEELEFSKKIKDAIGKVFADGVLSRFASKLKNPRGLALDHSGNLYVADGEGYERGRILRLRAPPPPTLAFPSFTNQNPLALNGKTEANSRIDAFLNDSSTPITVSTQDGSFALALNLKLNSQNFLDVFTTAYNGQGLTSAPADFTITHDNITPSISNLQPAHGSFLNNPRPLIQANFSDNLSGVDVTKVEIHLDGFNVTAYASVTASGFFLDPFNPSTLFPLSEGSHTVSVAISDRAGNSASVSSAFTIDITPPLITNLTPADGSILTTDRPLVAAQFSDNFGINLVSVRIVLDSIDVTSLAGVTASGFSLQPSNPLTQGLHTVSVFLSDLAGNNAFATSTFTVTTRPEITSISPGSGTLGTEVIIQGKSFDPTPGSAIVRFNGVQALITSITQTTIRTFVPLGATTGRVTVETPRGIGTSSEDFIVLLRQDFVLAVSPAIGTAVQGTSTSYAVHILSTGSEPFTGLAALTITALPAGVTASLSPSTIGPTTTGILQLSTANSTPVGSSIVELQATGQLEGRSITRTATITLGVQAPGQTILIGEVRDEQERPLAGVSIKLGGATLTELGTTDAGGNFFIPLSAVGPQVFLIDGSTANTPTLNYSTIPITLDIQPNVVNALGFTPRLHAQPVAKLTPITPSQQTVLTDPELPGFKMRIPTGVQIIGWDKQPNTQFSVIAVPVDRSPLPPLPSGQSSRQIYLFNFGKMGGGVPTGNIAIDTPNDVDGLPGEKIDLYYFNEAPDGTAPNQWEKYGTGTVSSDGTRIITDINPANGLPYGIPRFCCGARRNVPPPPPPRPGGGLSAGQSGSGQTAGEPVDTATGFFYVDKTDLVLPGILPIAITRTYRTQLTNAGPFGLGTSWPYDIFLQPPPNGSADSLILFTPGNRQDLFARQPDGSFTNSTSPVLRGAVVTTVGGVRSLRFKDGSLWRFDAGGKVISQADRNGNVLTLIRDAQGRVILITEPSGRQLTIFYAGTNLQMDHIQDPIGREVRYGYDVSARLTSVTDAAGGITRYTYDSSNRMVSITDPRGITFLNNVYDSAGRVIRQTQADGGIWTFSYTTTGSFISQTTVTDPRGNNTTYRFNAAGYLVSQTDALGQTTTFDRESGTNLIRTTTDPIGRVARFTYDASGNVTSISDPAGNVRRFEYEPTFNKLIKITDPLGQITRFEYDTRGNLTATVDPTGARTIIAYNAFGQPVSTADPLGNTTTFTYDDFGNLATIADPLGNETQRAYGFVSRLIEQTDPRGRSARFTYDGLNRITQILDPLNSVTSFTYDGNGNLLTVTDARGSSITHTYDVMDRLATRIDPLGRQETYQYDPAGNLTQATDRKNQVSRYTYDSLNRRVKSNFDDGTFTEFTYDAAGRLTQASDSQASVILEEYDLLDRLAREITPQGVVAYNYDALGRRMRMDVTGQAPVTYSYDAASRLTEVAQEVQVVNLTYDILGRRTRLTLPNSVSTEYHYDDASRLTQLIYQNAIGIFGNLTYQYDAAGNRIAVGGSFARTLLPDPVASATYDAANRQLTFGTKTMTFDANGNLTSINDGGGVTTFTWDVQNRLTAMTNGLSSLSFGYDALGRRVTRVADGLATTFQFSVTDVVRELQPGGEVSYLRGLGPDQTLLQGQATSYLTDATNNTIALVNATGAITQEYIYEPFGKTFTTGSLEDNRYQFTGRERESGDLYYYRARYYHAGLARFIQPDPLGLLAGINLYTYVENSPTNFLDPTGLRTYVVHGIWSGPSAFEGFRRALRPVEPDVRLVEWSGHLFGDTIPSTAEASNDLLREILHALNQEPLKPGEKLNLIGHSAGGIIVNNVANLLKARGIKVSNLIVMGSPQLSGVTNLPPPGGVPVTAIVGWLDPLASMYIGTGGRNVFAYTGVFSAHTAYTKNPTVLRAIQEIIR